MWFGETLVFEKRIGSTTCLYFQHQKIGPFQHQTGNSDRKGCRYGLGLWVFPLICEM